MDSYWWGQLIPKNKGKKTLMRKTLIEQHGSRERERVGDETVTK
jgi:hypothetical protein